MQKKEAGKNLNRNPLPKYLKVSTMNKLDSLCIKNSGAPFRCSFCGKKPRKQFFGFGETVLCKCCLRDIFEFFEPFLRGRKK